jgi:hypothetical protein
VEVTQRTYRGTGELAVACVPEQEPAGIVNCALPRRGAPGLGDRKEEDPMADQAGAPRPDVTEMYAVHEVSAEVVVEVGAR